MISAMTSSTNTNNNLGTISGRLIRGGDFVITFLASLASSLLGQKFCILESAVEVLTTAKMIYEIKDMVSRAKADLISEQLKNFLLHLRRLVSMKN